MITKKDSLYLKIYMNCTGWTLHKMPKTICSLDVLWYFMIYANACSIRSLSATLQISSRVTTVQLQFSSRGWQQHTFNYLFDAHYTATMSLKHLPTRRCCVIMSTVSTPSSLSAESSNFSYLLILGYGDRSCLISPLVLFCSIPPSPVHHAACCTAWWDKNHLSSSELKNPFFCSAEPVKKMLYLLQ